VPTKIKILLIEDDRDDVELLQEALNTNDVIYEMQVIYDGSEAVDFVRNCTVCPDVIILDYNLPKVHGKEVLKEIKASPFLKNIPVLVLTTSSSKQDKDYAYEMGASKFLIKPITMAEMRHTTNTIEEIAGVNKEAIK